MGPPGERLAYHQVSAPRDEAREPPLVQYRALDFAPNELDGPVARCG